MVKGILLFALGISLFSFSISFAETTDKSTQNSLHITMESLKSQLDLTNDGLKEVRRDQLNYKIEKDLLKETYSSNIQTINIVIAIVLCFFTIIGFLGVKSISSVKKDFQGELDELKKMRAKYEIKFEEIKKEQNKTNEEYAKLKTSTEDQEKRLKVLEVQEKAGAFITQKNYLRALSYISVGLELDPKDNILLRQKMQCQMALKQFQEATITGKIIIESDVDSLPMVANLCEACVLSLNEDEYKRLQVLYKEDLSKEFSPYLIWYFEAVILARKSNLEGYKKHLAELKTKYMPSGKSARIKTWDYTEIKDEIKILENGELKVLFEKTISFLEGSMEIEEVVV